MAHDILPDIFPPDPKLFATIYEVWEWFVHICERQGIEVGLRCEVVTYAMWCGELRITKEPCRRDQRPDVSTVLFTTGCHHAEHCIVRLLNSPEIQPLLQDLRPTKVNTRMQEKLRRILPSRDGHIDAGQGAG